MKAWIPNLLTLLNLFCGCLAIVYALNGDLYYVPYLVLIAAFADFFDGFVARWLKVSSSLGLQLDSLADMVTFGVVPGVVLFELLKQSYPPETSILYLAPAFIFTLFAAIRLAKFNIDTRQTDGFLGLPTPSSTLLIISLAYIADTNYMGLQVYLLQPLFLYLLTIVLSWMMVAEFPLFSMKFKSVGWYGNETRFIFMLLGFSLLGIMGFASAPPTIVLYFLLSFIYYRKDIL